MRTRVGQRETRVEHGRLRFAFTLVEVMVSLIILAMVISGVCYGYSQANRIAVWGSMSQAAQSFAIQGMEAARAAKWNPWVISTNTGPDPGGSQDELPATTNGVPSLTQTNILDIPMKGDPQSNYSYYATNYVYVTQYAGEPPIRQIRSDCVWTFPLTGQVFTNTVITLRGPDQ
jgi:prepilin-type N-terminal cleavage/methylation domain-containing protein